MMRAITLLHFLTFASATSPHHPTHAIKCPIIFDGRVPRNLALGSFDSAATSPYSPQFVKGENLTWSQILLLPNTSLSRFDTRSVHKPLEVTINDHSLFRPGGGNLQVGFRRAGLLLKNDTNSAGSDPADTGVVTFHWSVKQDRNRALNLSHEYMNVWHEKADYSGNQFTFVGGVVLEVDGGTGVDTRGERESWKVQDSKNGVVFRTPMRFGGWQNFAVQLDYVSS
ncbi:hypothetical protein P280DRAFT_469878 [Massarina eburnea CBS 473.64]|uniref:Glycoside hydrolase 131 catalytic N-terminal domain-containing protein n=1 Tax=Massarina eburnea CBS 473.64 TaxID=1395130 RepID=A0A6A6S1R5_9PLEO|nr:hypothetical protein P280DRAFT_469878 [Massarina eburnea CBS 473.64]